VTGCKLATTATSTIGVFGDYTGFLLENPRSAIPYTAWAAGDYRGIRGYISTPGKFFYLGHREQETYQDHPQKILQRLKKP
jgi:hypothetical protein